MSDEDFPVGARVTFAGLTDNVARLLELHGAIAEPTQAEIEYVKTYDEPPGPDHGEVLVQWSINKLERSWERPSVLRRLP